MKKILLTIFSIFLCLGLSKEGYGYVKYEDAQQKKATALHVSGIANYAPFGWHEKQGNISERGYYTVGQPILDMLVADIKAKIQYNTDYKDLDEIMQEVRKNEVDLFIGAYSQTEAFKGLHLLYPAFLYNPVTVFMIPHRVSEITSTDDLKKLKGVVNVNELFSDFVNKKIAELNPIEVSSPDEAFKKLFTREADYIITSYYNGMVEAIKLGLQNQIAPAKQTLWKIPLFIGVGKASVHREKLSTRITKYLNDKNNLKAIEEYMQKIINLIEQKYEGVVPPTYVKSQEKATQDATTSDATLQ